MKVDGIEVGPDEIKNGFYWVKIPKTEYYDQKIAFAEVWKTDRVPEEGERYCEYRYGKLVMWVGTDRHSRISECLDCEFKSVTPPNWDNAEKSEHE